MSVLRLYNDDESIIQGIKASDDRALKHLYETYHNMILKLVVNNSGTINDAEEVYVKTNTRKALSRMLLKGDCITLIKRANP